VGLVPFHKLLWTKYISDLLWTCTWTPGMHRMFTKWSSLTCSFGVNQTHYFLVWGRVHLKYDGTRWCTGGEVKGKLANGMGSQYSHTTSEHGVSSITTADAQTSAASSRPNWRPRWFKWTRPFHWKTKSGFYACAITFQTQSSTCSKGNVGRWCKSFNQVLFWGEVCAVATALEA
jgi:hypothetical protein